MKTKINKWNLSALISACVVILLAIINAATQQIVSNMLEDHSRWRGGYLAPTWFKILKNFDDFITEIAPIVMPILVVVVIVFLIIGNFEHRKFESKWGIFVTCIFYGLMLLNLNEVAKYIETKSYFALIQTIVSVTGFLFLMIALLEKKLWKLSLFGFSALFVSAILRIFAIIFDVKPFNDLIISVEIISAIVLATYILLVLQKTQNFNKFLRNLSISLMVIATIINLTEYAPDNIICVLAFVAFTYLLVPAKFKINSLKKVVSILFLVLTLSTVPYWLEAFDNNTYVATAKLSCGILGLFALFISLAFERAKRLSTLGFALLTVAIAMNIVAYRGGYLSAITLSLENISSFIEFKLLIADMFNLIAVILLMCIAGNTHTYKTKTRIAIIVLTAFSGYFSLNKGFSALYLLYLIAIVTTSIIIVPIKFTINNSIGKHLFLCIFTLGIWYLVWLYNATKYLNTLEEVQYRNPLKELLLCMFLPFYAVYWYYKTAEILEKHSKEKGIKSETPIVSLVFAIILPLVASVINQNKINEIITE